MQFFPCSSARNSDQWSRKLFVMNKTEFKELAKGKDFLRVVATCYADSHVIVSGFLRCDEALHLTPYNFLRNPEGQVVKFGHTEEAIAAIRTLGYRGEISFSRADAGIKVLKAS